jgi:tetratricopeptide (TPR) repeat protein
MTQHSLSPLPNPPTSLIEAEVEHIRTLVKSGQFAAAVHSAQRLIETVPENRDALYLLALAQRQSKTLEAALATLDKLERHHPNYSRLYQERGHCYVALKQAPAAIAAYQRAVAMNVALPASWDMLVGLYSMIGDAANADHARHQAAKLRALPPDVLAATDLYCDGQWTAAEKIIRAFLIKNGDHIEAMRLLARIGSALGVYDDSDILLAAVLDRVPDYIAARHDYACVLLERHKYQDARIQLALLLALDPANRTYRTLFATALVGLGLHDESVSLYRRLIPEAEAGTHERAELHLSIAHSLKTLGRSTEAVAAYQSAIKDNPTFGDAFWSLANLKTYRFHDNEIEQIKIAESSDHISTIDRYNLCFALGKALEDRSNYQDAFRYYERGNALKRAESRYRPDLLELNTKNQIRICTAEFFANRRDWGIASEEPIFILGLPRSGSTLVEQILASHSHVEGTQELADIPRLVLELQGTDPDLDNPRYPAILTELSREKLIDFGQTYLQNTKIYRTSKPMFIDKMPNNFRHIGLIHLMFPKAKIIDARREPMACCFGNLKQLFARGQEFTYSIEDIARYYRTYLELMNHWDCVLPGRVLRIMHEDLVDDLEGNVRRMLDYCGLDFEIGCVEFHKTKRSVRTASSEQVRQPIYREGLDQWRHFEPWLGDLKTHLGDALEKYR